MHIDKINPNFIYKLIGSELSEMDQERDLGLVMDNWMEVSMQCTATMKHIS